MTPEEKARVKIDQMFEDAGWQVVDRDSYSPTITAAAIREGLLEGNHEADYFLFINGKAIGVLEAKREEIDVTSTKVCEQTEMYVRGVPKGISERVNGRLFSDGYSEVIIPSSTLPLRSSFSEKNLFKSPPKGNGSIFTFTASSARSPIIPLSEAAIPLVSISCES